MSFIQMFVLAVVQGVAEFIPVSSSGHLVIVQALMDLREAGVTLEVMLHTGTLMAVIVIFWDDIMGLFKGFLGFVGLGKKNSSGRLLWMLVIASIPTAVVGMTFYGKIASFFTNASYVYGFLMLNGLYLVFNRFFTGGEIKLSQTGPLRAAVIGLSQVFAMLPGISRSGATITTGILLKMDRSAAARFSFLMSIPAVAGATLHEIKEISTINYSIFLLAGGVFISFISGYIAIKILLKVILAKKLHYFGYYCLVAGFFGLIFLGK